MTAHLIATLLCIFPGALCLMFFPRQDMTRLGRLALAAALTPLVGGVVVITLRATGSPLAHVIVPMYVMAIGGAIIYTRRCRGETPADKNTPSTWTRLALIAIFVGATLVVFQQSPLFRSYSTHGLMHAEIVYAIDGPQFPPTEPGMHGERLRYPWFAETTVAAIAKTADLAPTRVMNIINIIMLCATAMLIVEAGTAMRLPRHWSLAAAGIAIVGTNISGLIAFGLIDPTLDYPALLGDRRYTGVLRKFFAANLEPMALSLMAAILWSLAKQHAARSTAIIGGLALVTLALVYPHLFAPTWIAVALVTLLRWRSERTTKETAPQIVLFTWFLIVAAVVEYLHYHWLSHGSKGTATTFQALWPALIKGSGSTIALAPWLLIIIIGQRGLARNDATLGFGLLVAALLSMLASALLSMPGASEYKFMNAASMLLALPCAACLAQLQTKENKRWLIATLITIGALSFGLAGERLRKLPRVLEGAPALDESSFYVYPVDDDRGPRIREAAPPDAILIAPPWDANLGVYSSLPMFVRAEPEKQRSPGYTLTPEPHLVDVRGCSPLTFDFRQQFVHDVFDRRESFELNEFIDSVWGSGGPYPLYFAFTEPDVPLVKLIRASRYGQMLIDDDDLFLWLFPQPE